jgi:hypothetical protein
MYSISPPNKPPSDSKSIKIFLAGSIEQGVAEDWQKQVTAALNGLNYCLYNPRRPDWNAS